MTPIFCPEPHRVPTPHLPLAVGSYAMDLPDSPDFYRCAREVFHTFSAPSQGFPDADRFDPDRFNEERKEDIVHGRNFLTFGFGPHYCVGREYAINHLVRVTDPPSASEQKGEQKGAPRCRALAGVTPL